MKNHLREIRASYCVLSSDLKEVIQKLRPVCVSTNDITSPAEKVVKEKYGPYSRFQYGRDVVTVVDVEEDLNYGTATLI